MPPATSLFARLLSGHKPMLAGEEANAGDIARLFYQNTHDIQETAVSGRRTLQAWLQRDEERKKQEKDTASSSKGQRKNLGSLGSSEEAADRALRDARDVRVVQEIPPVHVHSRYAESGDQKKEVAAPGKEEKEEEKEEDKEEKEEKKTWRQQNDAQKREEEETGETEAGAPKAAASKNLSARIANELRDAIRYDFINIIAASFLFVTALSWNSTLNEFFDNIPSLRSSSKLIYSITVTVLAVLFIRIASRIVKKKNTEAA
jgi:hypothetical protein